MSATLTIQLDAETLKFAEFAARARKTTLTEVVSQQLKLMARNWHDSQSGKTPVTDSLRGSVPLPAGFDERAAIADELLKKHGV